MATDGVKLSFIDRIKIFFSSKNLMWMLGLALVIGGMIYFTGSTSSTKFKGNLIAESTTADQQAQTDIVPQVDAPADVPVEVPAQDQEIVAVNDEGLQPVDDGFSADAVITPDLQSPDEQTQSENTDNISIVALDDSGMSGDIQPPQEDVDVQTPQADVVEDIDAPPPEDVTQPADTTQSDSTTPDFNLMDYQSDIQQDTNNADTIAYNDLNDANSNTVATNLPALGSEGEWNSSTIDQTMPQETIQSTVKSTTQVVNQSVVKKAVKKAAPNYKNTAKTGPESLLYLFFMIAAFGATKLFKKQN